jgi:hypothetical protein
MLQVVKFAPPQVPSVVFPLSQKGKAGFTAGLVQLPDWHTPVPQKAEPVPHVPQ